MPISYVPVNDSGIVPPTFLPGLKYQWQLYNTLAGTFVTELPVTYGTYSWVVNAPGGGEIHMPLRAAKGTDAIGTAYEIMNIANFEEYSYTILVIRNNEIVWEGFIGRMRTNSLDSRTSFALIGLWDFFRGRFVRPSFVRTATDILAIVRNLIDHCQDSQPSSDLGIITGIEVCGVLMDLTVNDYDFKYYGDVIEDLTRSVDRFDFMIRTSLDVGGAVVRTLVLGCPKIGTRRPITLEYGKNMVSYQWNRDGSTRYNRTWGIGAGEASAAVLALAEDTSTFGRVPLRETLFSRKDIDLTQQSRLQSLVDGERRKNSVPVETITCQLISETGSDELVGGLTIGDSVMCHIDDGFTQVDGWYRIITMAVSVSQDMQELIDIDLAPEWATGGTG